MSPDCLTGFRVLDLSQYLPGPYATQILADLGAEVVKIEPPAGDPMRAIGPRDDDGVSAFYKLVNAGKTVVSYNYSWISRKGKEHCSRVGEYHIPDQKARIWVRPLTTLSAREFHSEVAPVSVQQNLGLATFDLENGRRRLFP